MKSFLEIKKDMQKKQRNSKKWRSLLYFVLIYLNIIYIPFIYLLKDINLFHIFIISVTFICDVMVPLILIFLHHIDRILKEENEIMEVANKTQVDEWLFKKKRLIASFSFWLPVVSKKKSMYPWGIIDKDDCYQIIFIDFSKKNALVILRIQKSEISQYDEVDTIKKRIYRIQKGVKRLKKLPISNQLYANARFFIVSSQKKSQ